MIIQIEISEEDAACIWADVTWSGKCVDAVAAILTDKAKEMAEEFRRAFPAEAALALESFRRSAVTQ